MKSRTQVVAFISGMLHGVPFGAAAGIALLAWMSPGLRISGLVILLITPLSLLPAALFDTSIAMTKGIRQFGAAAANQPRL